MKRISQSMIVLLILLGLGTGCSNDGGPSPGKGTAIPKEGPKSLERPWGAPPPPPSSK